MSVNRKLGHSRAGIVALTAGLLASASAGAAITISTSATQNMSCSGEVCEPTASTAVLNVNDLENYLAAGNLEVTTAGSGVDAEIIDVEAGLTWSNSSALSLVASQSIEIDQPVTVTGTGGLTLTNSRALEGLAFGSAGNVTFANLSSSLSINGKTYALFNTVKTLARAMNHHPDGDYALAASYDAKKDHLYHSSPINGFDGIFEGLGNTISNISIKNVSKTRLGFLATLASRGTIRDVNLANESVQGRGKSTQQQFVGGLVGDNYGNVFRSSTSGKVLAGCGCHDNSSDAMGGIVGNNLQGGMVEQSYSSTTVSGGAVSGGVIGINAGTATQSYATGAVSGAQVGGFVGVNDSLISESYATGSASGFLRAGGFLGLNDEAGSVTQSYSTGAVQGEVAGGFVGYDNTPSGSFTFCYWNLDTSGISNLGQGAGYPANDPGITGLTTAQFQSGLPEGFDPAVWAENSSLNGGLPYLIAIPPQ